MIKRTLFLIALATTVALVGSAAADPLPREMLGKWCAATGTPDNSRFERPKKGKCPTEDSNLTLLRDSIEYWEEGCTFTSITPRVQTTYFYNNRGKQETQYYKVFEVKAKCGGEGDSWNSTLFLSILGDGGLEHQSFVDNELPSDLFIDDTASTGGEGDSHPYHPNPAKSFCSETYNGRTTYFATDECDIGKNVRLDLGKDRYTIAYGNEGRGFCRYSSIRTVWDPQQVPATKTQGGPVHYITATCPKGTMNLRLENSKGSWYLEEVKR